MTGDCVALRLPYADVERIDDLVCARIRDMRRSWPYPHDEILEAQRLVLELRRQRLEWIKSRNKEAA